MTTVEVVGTNGCVDPAVQSTGRYDETSDGYSLGVTLLVVLTGRLPFDGDDDEPVLTTRLHDVLQGEVEASQVANSAAGWSSEAAHEVVQVCKRLLHPVRRQRPSIAAAMPPLEHLLSAHYGGRAWRRRGEHPARVGGGRQDPRRTGRGGGVARHGTEPVRAAEASPSVEPGASTSAAAGPAGGGSEGVEEEAEGRGGEGAERQCIVCLSEPRQVRFSCGHAVVCNRCAGQVGRRA